MGAPVLHFEIMGGPEGQLENFYSQLFDWKIDSNNPMKYGIVDTGGQGGINGGVGPEMAEQGGTTRVSIYAAVSDIPATLAKVESLGGKVLMPETEVPGGPVIAMFSDPAGNVTGLMKA